MQVKKREFHTLKKNTTNNLNYKLSGVLLVGVLMFSMAIISYIFVNLCKINFIDLYCSVNLDYIYIYFLSLVLTFIFIVIYDFLLKKILLIKIFKNRLPAGFISGLSKKVKIRDRFFYIFSLNFFKIFLLTSFFLLLPYILYYILFYSFLYTNNLFILVIYILYISICINLSNCFINSKNFFSMNNMCNIGYSFILLLWVKFTVISIIPILLPYLVTNSSFIAINKHIAFIEKATLNFLKKLPVVHKLVFIKINNNSFLNSSLVKFKHHNHNTSVQLNSSNVKYIPFSNHRVFTNINSKPCSVIISAIQSAKVTSSCLMFTYNHKSNFIVINRISVVNIPRLNTQILRVDLLGFLPKSGYFHINKPEINLVIKSKPLEIPVYSSKNVLLKNTNSYKPLSDWEKGIFEYTLDNKPNISLPSDLSYLSANPDKFNLDMKINQYMDMNNISPDLLNPIVYMFSFSNQDQNPEGNEYNKGNNNKGKGKATDQEMEEWDKQDTGQEFTEMDIDTDAETSLEDRIQEQAARNLASQAELNEQVNLWDSYSYRFNTLNRQGETESEVVEDTAITAARSNFINDRDDVRKAINFFIINNVSADENVTNITSSPSALDRIMTQYASYFDEDSGNQSNIVQGLNQVNDYLREEEKAVVIAEQQKVDQKRHEASIKSQQDYVADKSKDKKAIAFLEPITDKAGLSSGKPARSNSVYDRLGFSTKNEYNAAVENKYNELYQQHLNNNLSDLTQKEMRSMKHKARLHVNRTRERELNPTEYKQKIALNTQNITNLDPSYISDKKKIMRNNTLSPEQRDIELQARKKLHQDILKENKNKKKE